VLVRGKDNITQWEEITPTQSKGGEHSRGKEENSAVFRALGRAEQGCSPVCARATARDPESRSAHNLMAYTTARNDDMWLRLPCRITVEATRLLF
jgi:hypothetical protein